MTRKRLDLIILLDTLSELTIEQYERRYLNKGERSLDEIQREIGETRVQILDRADD